VYIGSTSNLTARINTHLSSFKTNTSKCSSRFVLSNNNYQISVLVDKIVSKEIAKVKENDFIRAYGDEICVNINKPIIGITMKEYQHNYQKIYRESKKSKSNVEENPPQELTA
jgi:hypothetical protein